MKPTTTTINTSLPAINPNTAPSFDIDISDFLNPEDNVVRERNYPASTVINRLSECPAGVGIFISERNLISAGWKIIDKSKFVEAEWGDKKESGYILTKVNMAIIKTAPLYLRFKADKDKSGDFAGKAIGLLDDYQDWYKANKNLVDVCCERLIMFFDDQNQPLHTVPVKVRFRNVSHWASADVFNKFYAKAEAVFTAYASKKASQKIPSSAKSDRWRSACRIKCTFFPEMTGAGSNRSQCCKIKDDWLEPTELNIQDWLITDPEVKALVWEQYDIGAEGFVASVEKMLPPAPEALALPAAGELRSAAVDF